MFDLGMSELLVIGVVALIVVGPRDLPGMFRTVGRFTGKARELARDLQRAMDQAADEADAQPQPAPGQSGPVAKISRCGVVTLG